MSGSCQEAIANGGNVGNGKLGETQIISYSGGTSLIIDTKVKDGEVLNNTIKLQWAVKPSPSSNLNNQFSRTTDGRQSVQCTCSVCSMFFCFLKAKF